ncbi:hypothetical protein RZS28_04070 [Methylocapsa polymorpha]|uniref:Uncharacterized protein n=1 Tax=Methylocapsa polymorpha TaxID=3080828 RepID=A0ABZ0HVW2_9HYPH|nr:hypothetical protein RZS28_04070 [Methylocapsa sp. RX1]
MNEQIAAILARIRDLEDELGKEVDKERKLYGPTLKKNVAEFQQDVLARHRRLRMGLLQFFKETPALNLLTSPVIYSLLAPLALLDIWVTVYQHICFRAYGIPRVTRSEYVVIDRHHLSYLNLIEAINCAFCGYANGVISYAREIAGRTEQHWCPIKHALRIRDPHARYLKFLEYGDAEGYRSKLEEFRKNVD